MGLNTKEFAVKFTGELDKVLCQQSAVGFMTDNVFRAKFLGAKTVKIPSVSMEGLGDYDREKGFISGSVNVSDSIYEMKQDRARTFSIDREDLDESGVAELAGSVMSEFVRTKVAPETDAYVISKLAGLALDRGQAVVGMDITKPFECFSELLSNVQSAAGFDEEIVCFVNPNVWKAFRMSNEFSKYITVGAFEQGAMDLQVHMIDNVPIIPVSYARMQTAFDFLNGKEAQTAGGFSAASGAKGIYMLMLPKKAASLVRKSETIRTFTPEQNIDADAYKFDYRVYYDVFVKTSYLSSVWAVVGNSINVVSDVAKNIEQTKGDIDGSISVSATASDGATIKYEWYQCEDATKANSRKISGEDENTMEIDTALDCGKYYYYVRMIANDSTVVESSVCCVSVN